MPTTYSYNFSDFTSLDEAVSRPYTATFLQEVTDASLSGVQTAFMDITNETIDIIFENPITKETLDTVVENHTGLTVTGFTPEEEPDGNSEVPSNVLQVRRTTPFNPGTSYANINFDVIDVGTNADSITWNSNNSEFDIGQTDYYDISYSFSVNLILNDPSTYQFRLLKNGTTEVPSSFREVRSNPTVGVVGQVDQIDFPVTHVFSAFLEEGDTIVLQAKENQESAGEIHSGATLRILNLRGKRGETGKDGRDGAPGSGSTIAIQENGTNVAGGPHSTLNVIGLVATDEGNGSVRLENVFGTYFEKKESLSTSSSTSTILQPKISHITQTVPAGTYRIGWSFGWSLNKTSRNFKATLEVDDQVEMEFIEEPKEASSQKNRPSGFIYKTFNEVGTHTIKLKFASSFKNALASMFDARIEFWRVS